MLPQRYYVSKTVYARQDISYFIKYVYELLLIIKSRIFDQRRNVTDCFLTYEKEKKQFHSQLDRIADFSRYNIIVVIMVQKRGIRFPQSGWHIHRVILLLPVSPRRWSLLYDCENSVVTKFSNGSPTLTLPRLGFPSIQIYVKMKIRLKSDATIRPVHSERSEFDSIPRFTRICIHSSFLFLLPSISEKLHPSMDISRFPRSGQVTRMGSIFEWSFT